MPLLIVIGPVKVSVPVRTSTPEPICVRPPPPPMLLPRVVVPDEELKASVPLLIVDRAGEGLAAGEDQQAGGNSATGRRCR